ncbi:MAG: hypothetical protein JST39_25450, partial [Bacteroidetes bacterium]|nr:hypothetical protein [Bacteroidota bacterium]
MKLFDKIFRAGRNSEPAELTTITRTEVLEGFSIPGIVHNVQYHLIDLQIYSDGLVSCWEMVDLTMFRSKLNTNWIVTLIPDGEPISINSLGYWYIEKGEWLHTRETLYDYVYSLVKRLNPGLDNLQNYHGESAKMIGRARVAKHFVPSPKPYRLDDPNSFLPGKINGEKFYIFYRDDDSKTYLAVLSIYKSGLLEITNIPSKKTFSFDSLRELMNRGQITTNLKAGETVTIPGLGSFVVKSGEGVDITAK